MICYLRDGKKIVCQMKYKGNSPPSRYLEFFNIKDGSRMTYEISGITMNKGRTKAKAYYYNKIKFKKLHVS